MSLTVHSGSKNAGASVLCAPADVADGLRADAFVPGKLCIAKLLLSFKSSMQGRRYAVGGNLGFFSNACPVSGGFLYNGGFSKKRIHVAMITKALPLPVWDANANVYPTGSGIVTGFPPRYNSNLY